jgi:hypothetical protein
MIVLSFELPLELNTILPAVWSVALMQLIRIENAA